MGKEENVSAVKQSYHTSGNGSYFSEHHTLRTIAEQESHASSNSFPVCAHLEESHQTPWNNLLQQFYLGSLSVGAEWTHLRRSWSEELLVVWSRSAAAAAAAAPYWETSPSTYIPFRG